MTDVKHPTVRQYHPATFLERGVAIPFTTPLLYGTRARPAHRRGAELIIPNPAGGRGVYIMPWASMVQLCTPTLHDRIFNEQIALLPAVTPAAIRRVARIIAMEGLAGEQAMDAAAAAVTAETKDRTLTNFELLMRLVEQAAAAPSSRFARSGPHAPDAARRAQLAVDWAAQSIGRPVSWVANALEQLADVITPVGTGSCDTRARLPRLLTALREVRQDIEFWCGTQVEEDLVAHCQVIRQLADLTLLLGDDILRQAQDLTADMLTLLRRWATENDVVAEEATRPYWLLDGWDQICLVWTYARDDAGRRAAVAEIVGLAPVLPREAEEWCTGTDAINDMLRFRRLVPVNEDWRTGVIAFRLIERNEYFRAMAA